MGLFNLLGNKKRAVSEVLSQEESEVLLQIAETAGLLMRSEYESAVLLLGQEYKSDVIEFSFPFAFGILIAALEGAGISWMKFPYIGINYIEKWMQSSADSEVLTQIMFKSGTEDKYAKYRDAGMRTFANFINHDEDLFYKTKGLAKIILNNETAL